MIKRIYQGELFDNPGKKPGKADFRLSFPVLPGAGKSLLFVIIALFCLMPGRSYGLSVSYNYLFSGTMASESNATDGPHFCSPGDPFSGVMRYTYDSEAQPVYGHYTAPDDFWEVYPHAFEYTVNFNGIAVYSSTDLIVSSNSSYTPPGTINLNAYGTGVVYSTDPKISCVEADLEMLYHNPLISGSNRLPLTLNAQQIGGMHVWFAMGYDTWPEHPENEFIEVWAQVDTVTPVAPVPEPATMFLLGSGFLGLAGLRKKLE